MAAVTNPDAQRSGAGPSTPESGATQGLAERPDPDTVIRMAGVGVRRSGNDLLAGLDWSVELDERWVVLGPNGAGKTTLLRLAAAELHPTTGDVDLLGERIGRVNIFDLRPRIGFTSPDLPQRAPGDQRGKGALGRA